MKNYLTRTREEDREYALLTLGLAGGAIGGAIGYVAAKLSNRQLQSKIKELVAAGKNGGMNPVQAAELNRLRAEYSKRIKNGTLRGAAIGAVSTTGIGLMGGGGTLAAAGAKGLATLKSMGAAGLVGAGAAGYGIHKLSQNSDTDPKSSYDKDSIEVRYTPKQAKAMKMKGAVIGGAVGGAVGFGAGHLATSNSRSVLAELEAKPKKTEEDLEEIARLRKKINTIKAATTVAGLAGGGALGYYKGKKNSEKVRYV